MDVGPMNAPQRIGKSRLARGFPVRIPHRTPCGGIPPCPRTVYHDLPATVADELSRHPEGVTARKLAGITSLPLAGVGETLRALEAAGTATRSPGESGPNGRKGADLWHPVTPDG